ncbi:MULTISPECIES: hypothetical protein [Streptomyces]|uniref:DUF308 domain-containing protein n=1 Tax=Streptomyces luteosporeus TaxID=173856 RepID=A0ABN3U1Z1_9ACTN
MASYDPPADGRSLLGPTPGERVFLWSVLPLLGAAVAWLLKASAGWVASLPWAPLHGPFKLVASVPEPYATIGAVVLGLAAGGGLALLTEREYVTAVMDGKQVSFTRNGHTRTVPRDAVAAVFRDGKRIVLLGGGTQEVARISGEFSVEAFEAAFTRHGWPWQPDGDPHRAAFRRWIAGDPALSPAAHALLRARAHALGKSRHEDAEQLRADLGAMGIVVREEGRRQDWRRSGGEADGA